MILKSKYNVSMDKVTMSNELKDKIMTNSYVKKNIKINNKTAIKCICSIAACLVFFFIINLHVDKLSIEPPNSSGSQTQVVNPIEDIDSIDALKDKVEYEFKFPDFMPTNYELVSSSVLGGNMINIIFSNENNEIVYRTAPIIEDISGDYNKYDVVSNEKVLNYNVTLKSSNNKYYVASWNDGSLSYSIVSTYGIDKEVMIEIINNIMN